MEIKEFRKNVRPGKTLIVEGVSLEILQVIKYRLDDNSYYYKCYLSDKKAIAEDSEMNMYIFVDPVITRFSEPMPEILIYDNKKFHFLYETKATAEDVWGKGEFKIGDRERFWDYQAQDESYLSLGVNEMTGEKADFYGRTVAVDKVDVR